MIRTTFFQYKKRKKSERLTNSNENAENGENETPQTCLDWMDEWMNTKKKDQTECNEQLHVWMVFHSCVWFGLDEILHSERVFVCLKKSAHERLCVFSIRERIRTNLPPYIFIDTYI